MFFEHTNMVRTQHNKSQFAAFQILLIFEALIRRDHDSKPGVFRCPQKITVNQPRPARFLSRADVVFCEKTQKWVRVVLIKQNAQIAGSRRTALRL